MPHPLLVLITISIEEVEALRHDTQTNLAEVARRLQDIHRKLQHALEPQTHQTEHPNTV